MADTNNGVDRRVFLRLLSGGALTVATGGFLAGCGGGGGGGGSNGNNNGIQTFNYPNVTLGGQAGSLSVTTQSSGSATGALTVPADSGAARPRAAARPHDATPPPSGNYAFSGNSTASTGGFTVSGTATYTPSPAGTSLSGPFTLAVTVPTEAAAGAFAFTFSSTTYNGTIPATNVVGVGRLGGQAASLTFNSITGITPPSENPVDPSSFIPAAVQVVWNNGNISASQIVQYQVYRNPEPLALKSGTNLNASPTVAAAFAPLPIFCQAASPAFDSVQDVGPLFVQQPDPTDDTKLVAGDFYQTNPNGSGGTLPGEVPVSGTGLQVGDRVNYQIRALYKSGNGGTVAYALSEPVTTNAVTYLQPPLLSETITTAMTTTGFTTSYPHVTSIGPYTPDNDVFGLSAGPNNIIATFRAVYINPASTPDGAAGLKYALDFSTDPTFPSTGTLRYTQTTPAQGGSETNPRGVGTGAVVIFGSAGGSASVTIDLTSTTAQAILGSSPASVYVRAGVRDTRDPDDTTFIFSTLDGLHYTDPVSRSYLLPSQLTPGGGNHDGSARPH